MGTVVEFQRFQKFINPTITEIRNFVEQKGWKNFTVHWNKWVDEDTVLVERLPEGK